MSHVFTPLAIGSLGTTELLIILGVLVLLFGAKKLPELARGSGRALRIFKAETKGLAGDDEEDEEPKTEEQRQIEQSRRDEQARSEGLGSEHRHSEHRHTEH